MTMRARSFSMFQKLGRLIKYRLLIPLVRSQHPPEYKARGVAVGMAWAMTPLVGIQMWLVLMTWAFLRKVFKWHFSLPLALAYTWVSNVFTLVPIYYGFYVTGQIMRGNGAHIQGYKNLKQIIETTFLSDYDFYQKWALFFKLLLKDWGVSMAIGCIPWAIVFGIGSYYVTMKYAKMRDKLRQMRLEKALERERLARENEYALSPSRQAALLNKHTFGNQKGTLSKRAASENEKATPRVSIGKEFEKGKQSRTQTKSTKRKSSGSKKQKTAKHGTSR